MLTVSPKLPGDSLKGCGPKVASFENKITTMCPNLVAFILHGDEWEYVFDKWPNSREAIAEFMQMLLEPLHHLQYLDLSYWICLGEAADFFPKTLTTLILHDVHGLHEMLTPLMQLPNLR